MSNSGESQSTDRLTRIAGQSYEHSHGDHEWMEKGDAEVDQEVEHCNKFRWLGIYMYFLRL